MAVLGQNNCTPTRIFGPLSQYILCGCSIRNISMSCGWNEQASSITVDLVQDPCVGPKIWWDKYLNRQTGNIADPGFTYPEPGCAVYLRIEENPDASTDLDRGGFEYCGLVESWTENFDANGNPVYTLLITDPRIILENTQVIVNDFPGTTSGVWNLINAYGYVESLGDICTSSPAGGIGGTTYSNLIGNISNERGMLWNDLKCALHTLTSSPNRLLAKTIYNGYCRDARLTYVGPTNDGYGVIEKDGIIADSVFYNIDNANLNVQFYSIDLSEIPFSPLYYRVSGPNISLMEIISQVCSDAGCDYYIELLPVYQNARVEKIIKVRIANRQAQPQLGKLDEYIAAKQAQASNANGGIIAYTRGEEVRNEETSIYLIGGKRRDPYEADATQMLPFWGLDTNGNIINAQIIDNEYYVRLDLSKLNTTLFNPFASQYQWVSESELKAAIYSLDTWAIMVHSKAGDFKTYFDSVNFPLNIRLDKLKESVESFNPAHSIAVGMKDANGQDQDITSNLAKDLDKIYEFVKTYANTYYGKQFIVAAPFVCYTTDVETSKLRYSHEPSTDGCWVSDDTATVIGLTHNSEAADFFRDEQGKYGAILAFPVTNAYTIGGAGGTYTPDLSKISDDDYITDATTYAWVKADVDPGWLVGTPLDPTSSTISFILRTSSPVLNRVPDVKELPESFGALGPLIFNAESTTSYNVDFIDKGSFTFASINTAIAPVAALCPTLNHVQVYGPWGVAGLPGQVQLETDEGFTPWEYGSDTVMNQAALNKVATAVTQMRKGERGTVTVAGFPNIPLGAELFSVDSSNPPASVAKYKYIGLRALTISQCAPIMPYWFLNLNSWDGTFGPNVTNINVNVGPNGFTTEYQFSTYTPRFGRFNKDNAERLKRIGQTRLQYMRNLRANNGITNSIKTELARTKEIVESQLGKTARAPKSAHHVFIGRYTGSNRPEVLSQAIKETTLTFQNDSVYENSAIMSMDGLIRPVSISGGNVGLSLIPKVANEAACSTYTYLGPLQSDPPIQEYTPLSVEKYYLNPFDNPSGPLSSRSDSATSGHDIEILGRNSSAPSSGFTITEGADGGEGYASDYRFLALRGPVMITQWGYDKQGKPIPNAVDTTGNMANGIYATGALEDKFFDAWLQKPETWPTAPLDLRFDRSRGVWTTPVPPRIIHATVSGNCLLTNGTATPDNIKTVYDSAGTEVSNTTINIEWPWSIDPPTGIGKIPTYYDNIDCKYYAIPINRLDVKITGGPIYRDVKQIHFSEGFRFDSYSITDCNNTLTISASGGLAEISGTGIRIVADNWCKQSFSHDQNSIEIDFGSGFCVSAPSSNVSRVDVCLSVDGSTKNLSNCTLATSASVSENFVALDFAGWLSTTYDADFCTATISGITPAITIGPTGTCRALGSDPLLARRLAIGSGLNLASFNGSCENQRIDSIINASGLNTNGTVKVGPKIFENIRFVGNLSTKIWNDCTVEVSGIVGAISISGLNSCGLNNTAEVGSLSRLGITTGLDLVNKGGGKWEIGTILDIQGYDNECSSLSTTNFVNPFKFTRLSLGDGLFLSQSSCTANITAYNFVSGTDVCDRSRTIPYGFINLGLGTGLVVGNQDSNNCSVTIHSRIKASGLDASRNDVGPKIFENICFVGSLETRILDDCTVLVSGLTGLPFISGSDWCSVSQSTTHGYLRRLEAGTGISLIDHGAGNFEIKSILSATVLDNECIDIAVGVPVNHVNHIDFSSGIKTKINSDCSIEVTALQYAYGVDTDCGTFSPSPPSTLTTKTPFTTLVFGTGLQVTNPGGGNCELKVDMFPVSGGGCNTEGQVGHGGSFPWYPTDDWGVSTLSTDGCGPFNELNVPTKPVTHFFGGPGIGLTSFGPCSLVLFANQIHEGLTNGGCGPSNNFVMSQVYKTTWGNNFLLTAGLGAGGTIAQAGPNSDDTLHLSVDLNEENGTWKCCFVKSISTTSTTINGTSVITSVTPTYGYLSGTISCGCMYWIKELDCNDLADPTCDAEGSPAGCHGNPPDP